MIKGTRALLGIFDEDTAKFTSLKRLENYFRGPGSNKSLVVRELSLCFGTGKEDIKMNLEFSQTTRDFVPWWPPMSRPGCLSWEPTGDFHNYQGNRMSAFSPA